MPMETSETPDLCIMQAKTRYKEAFGRLRTLKSEIEHLHRLLEHNRLRLQHDFELWLTDARERMGLVPLPGGATIPGQATAELAAASVSSQHVRATSSTAPQSPAPSALPGTDGRAQPVSSADQPSRAHQSVRAPLEEAEGPGISIFPQQASSSRDMNSEDGSRQTLAQHMQHAVAGPGPPQQCQQQQADSISVQGPLPLSRSAHSSGAKISSVSKLDMSKLHKHATGQQPASAASEASGSANASTSLSGAPASDSRGHAGRYGDAAAATSSSQVSAGRNAAEDANFHQRQATSDQVIFFSNFFFFFQGPRFPVIYLKCMTLHSFMEAASWPDDAGA